MGSLAIRHPGGRSVIATVTPIAQGIAVPAPAAPPAPRPVRGATTVIAVAIASSIYLQRFVLPAPRISVAFLVLFALAIIVLLLRIGSARVERLVVAGALITLAGVSVVLSGIWTTFDPTLESFLLLILAWLPLVVLVRPDPAARPIAWDRIMLIVAIPAAIATLLQLGLQFTPVGWVDPIMDLPETVRYTQQEYSVSYPYFWGSEINKPNGFVFLEPSMVAQFMGVAAIAALAIRPVWAILFVAALATTVSGTGLIALAVGVPFVLLKAAPSLRIIVVAVGGALVAVVLMTPLGALFQERSGEIDTSGESSTSGTARFIEPYTVMFRSLTDNPLHALIGTGPGTGQDVADAKGLGSANLPFVPKAVTEYGLVFGVALSVVVLIAIFSARAVSLANRVVFVAMIYLLSGALIQGPTALLLWSAVFASGSVPQAPEDPLASHAE